MMTIGPNIFHRRKCQISRRFLANGLFVVTCAKAYLRYLYLMSLTVILLLIVMVTAGPERIAF